MTSDVHIRARAFICEAALGTLAEADERWLREHLDGCGECRAQQGRMQEAVDAVRATPITAPPVLVSRTRAIVRSRSRELQEASVRNRMLMISCSLALAWTILAVPAIWGLYTYWTGATALTASGLTWMAAMAWLWFMPALFGSAVLLTNREGRQSQWLAAQKGWTRD